jgi:hypothetical protein
MGDGGLGDWETTPFPLKDYRLAFSLCPLRSLRLCLDLLNRRGTRRAQIAAVKKRSLAVYRVEV